MKLVLATAVTACLGAGVALAEAPRVVATIKPIHSLVSAVMGDLGTPELIVRGGASPHTYSLRPSDARALEQGEVVFWTGHGMELFLEGSLDSLAADAVVVELADSPGVTLLPVREGGAFEAHTHEREGHEHHDHDDEAHDHEDHAHQAEHAHDAHDHEAHDHEVHAGEGGMDMHYWLDPANAAAMVAAIADTLSSADPANAATYAANAQAEAARLEALTSQIDAQLAPVRDVPFVVFHDAYQYFEHRFDLTVAGSITVTPDTMPGAARINEIRERLSGASAACVFAEPQFEPAIVETVVEGTNAHAGTLDPEGAGLNEGPELYAELLGNLADALSECLGGR